MPSNPPEELTTLDIYLSSVSRPLEENKDFLKKYLERYYTNTNNTKENLLFFLNNLTPAARGSLESFLEHCRIGDLPNLVNQEEIELAERWNNLLSIILHCASNVFNTVIDFSRVQANIKLIYPTYPESVREFLGYHSLEELLIKYRQNLNLLWDKLGFLATVRPENLKLFLPTPDEDKPSPVKN